MEAPLLRPRVLLLLHRPRAWPQLPPLKVPRPEAMAITEATLTTEATPITEAMRITGAMATMAGVLPQEEETRKPLLLLTPRSSARILLPMVKLSLRPDKFPR